MRSSWSSWVRWTREEEEWRQYLEDRPIKAAGKTAEPKAPSPGQPDPKPLQQVKKP